MSFPHSFTKTAGERVQKNLEANRKWRANNVEKMREIGRKNAALFRERHPEHALAKKREHYKKNRAYYIEKSRQWRLANAEKQREHSRNSYYRAKARKEAKKCLSCESILTEQTLYCAWCVSTYSLSHAN